MRYLGNQNKHHRKKLLATIEVLDLWDEKKDLEKRYNSDEVKEQKEACKRPQKALKKGTQDEDFETCLKNKKQQKSISVGTESYFTETTKIHNYPRQVLQNKIFSAGGQNIAKGYAYNHEGCGDNAVLVCNHPAPPPHTHTHTHPPPRNESYSQYTTQVLTYLHKIQNGDRC